MEEHTVLLKFFTDVGYHLSVILFSNGLIISLFSRKSAEIIPKSSGIETEGSPYPPLLYADGHLGVPEDILYKSYISTCKTFRSIPSDSLSQMSVDGIIRLLAQTAIILLATPAHDTALNCRKLLLLSNKSAHTYEDELRFTACLLGNKPASKSSLLWHHRRWILRRLHKPPQEDPDNRTDSLINYPLPISMIETEFSLVSCAAEVYPRNYHAWLHRFLCSECLVSMAVQKIPGSNIALVKELDSSRRWVELHVSDYTSMSYFAKLLSKVHGIHKTGNLAVSISSIFQETLSSPPEYLMHYSNHPAILHALSLVVSYPTHQSLWLYLRLIDGLYDTTIENYGFIRKILLDLKPTTNEASSDIGKELRKQLRTEDELQMVMREVQRFIAWKHFSVSFLLW